MKTSRCFLWSSTVGKSICRIKLGTMKWACTTTHDGWFMAPEGQNNWGGGGGGLLGNELFLQTGLVSRLCDVFLFLFLLVFFCCFFFFFESWIAARSIAERKLPFTAWWTRLEDRGLWSLLPLVVYTDQTSYNHHCQSLITYAELILGVDSGHTAWTCTPTQPGFPESPQYHYQRTWK